MSIFLLGGGIKWLFDFGINVHDVLRKEVIWH
jgi:hypothetical protein